MPFWWGPVARCKTPHEYAVGGGQSTPSSFGDYPAHPWAGCFFQTPGPSGEFSAI